MPKFPTGDSKQEAREMLQNYLEEEQPVEKEKLVAEAVFSFSLSYKRAETFIETMQKSDDIEVDEGKVRLK